MTGRPLDQSDTQSLLKRRHALGNDRPMPLDLATSCDERPRPRDRQERRKLIDVARLELVH